MEKCKCWPIFRYPARDGSWCFGATVCGRCHGYYGEWSKERRETVAAEIDNLPSEKQQMAAAFYSGER